MTELLERFRRGPELLAVILTGVYGEEIDFRLGPDEWSIREIMAHLADAELVGAFRFRAVIAEDNPTLAAFDQDRWAARLDYQKRKPTQSLEAFRRLRAENFDLLKDLPESAWARQGVHRERGPVTLRQLLEIYAGHAEAHARKLQRIRDAYKQAKGKK